MRPDSTQTESLGAPSIGTVQSEPTAPERRGHRPRVAFLAVGAFLLLFLLTLLRDINSLNDSSLDTLLTSLIAGLAGIATISAFMLALNVDRSVEEARSVANQVQILRRLIEETSRKATEERRLAKELLDTSLILVNATKESVQLERSEIKSAFGRALGIFATSWSARLSVDREGKTRKLAEDWWSELFETYAREEAFDIYRSEIVTNARNYLLFILGSVSSLLKSREASSSSRVAYFACTAVPPRYYYNFPYRERNGKLLFHCHPRINNYRIALQAIIKEYGEQGLDVSRAVLAPQNLEESNEYCRRLGWGELDSASSRSLMEADLNSLYLVNVTLPGIRKLTSAGIDVPEDILIASLGAGHDELPAEMYSKPFIPFSQQPAKLLDWWQDNRRCIREVQAQRVREAAKEVWDFVELATTSVESDMPQFRELASRVHQYVEQSLENFPGQLSDFYKCFHFFDLLLAQLLKNGDSSKAIAASEHLVHEIGVLWQHAWAEEEEGPLSLREQWRDSLHTENQAWLTEPLDLFNEAASDHGIRPNFTLFGDRRNGETEWLLSLGVATDQSWHTAEVRLGDASDGDASLIKSYENLRGNLTRAATARLI